jgi:NADPH:quinone reductase-like Zn-dependent oxidoreductase
MTAIPSTCKAVTVQTGKSIGVTTIPTPQITQPNEIIVKVHSCALNPTDPKGIASGRAVEGRIVGTDFAGVVAAVGADVKHVEIGDRVLNY